MSAAASLCFVHGLACAPEDWDQVRAALGPQYPSQAVDLGFFEPDAGTGRPLTIPDLAARVTAEMGERTILVGHSLGCRVVLQAALERPERTLGVVLVDGSRLALLEPASFLEPIARDHLAFLAWFFGEMIGPRMAAATAERLVARARRMSQPALAAAVGGLLRWDREESGRVLQALAETPILALQTTTLGKDGKRRALCEGEGSAWGDFVEQEARSARAVTLAGFGHFPMLEDPEAVAAALRAFVRDLGGPT